MNQCIKCGVEIPEGELFCVECSLNAEASVLKETKLSERIPMPKGKMQTPVPVKHPRIPNTPAVSVTREKPRSRGGLIAALCISLLLLLASTGFQLWQYGSIQVEKNRLRTKEADLALRQSDMDELERQLDELNVQLTEAMETIQEKEDAIQELEERLSATQSSQSQGQYDLTAKQQELDRLTEENLQLLAHCEELELEIDDLKKDQDSLKAALEAAKPYKVKADFMDSYVVFVENDKTNHYHTYDCSAFPRNKFWAYSRKLAEAQGFTACPTCGGMP